MPLVFVKSQRKRYTGRGAYRKKKYGGRGAYTIDDGPWANRGASIGNAIGNLYGAGNVGSWLGRRLFHYPAKWFGSGAYKKKRSKRTVEGKGSYEVRDTPSGIMAPEIPRFEKSGGDDAIMISHREYIGDIFTSSSANTFNVNEFNLNPGDPVAFPWLSTVAQTSYQQYKFVGCVFEFISTSSDALNSTNTALGAVIACVNYDSNDPPFTSRMQMENTSWANCCKPSQNMSIPVECDPRMTAMQGMLYVSQNGVLPSNADPKTYYLGKVSIATTGFQGTNINIGSMYVTYKIKLYKPIMLPPLANANRVARVRNTVSNAAPFGTGYTSYTASDCDTMGITFTGTTMTIAKSRLQIGQRFLLILQWVGGATAVSAPAIGWSANVFASYGIFGGTAGASFILVPANGVSNTDYVYTGFIEIRDDNTDAVLTLGGGGTLPTAPVLNFTLWQVCGMPSARLGII